MQNSKLLMAIKSLSAQETRKFREFVSSPYVTKNQRALKLLDHIMGIGPGYDSRWLDKREIFSTIFPGTTFNEQKLRLEISDLYLLIKQFLTDQAMREDGFQPELYLLTKLREKNLERIFATEVNALRKKLEQQPIRDSQFYYTQFKIAAEKNGYYGMHQQRVFDESLQQKVDFLDMYYFTIKLKETCEMLNRNTILEEKYQLRLVEEIISFLGGKPSYLWDQPIIRVYFQIILMLSKPDEEAHFTSLMNLLPDIHHVFERNEARGMYKQALNYCIKKINRGQGEFLEHLFAVYQQLLANGLLLSEEKISHSDFKNISTVGLRLKKFDWVLTFLKTYRPLISGEHPESIYNYCLAGYYVAIEQPGQAIKLLQTVTFSDDYIQVSARQLLLKIFYQQAESTNTILYHLDAFIIFLRRNKQISKSNRTSMLNFLQVARKLILLRDKKDTLSRGQINENKLKLHDRIDSFAQIAERNWLVEEIQKL